MILSVLCVECRVHTEISTPVPGLMTGISRTLYDTRLIALGRWSPASSKLGCLKQLAFHQNVASRRFTGRSESRRRGFLSTGAVLFVPRGVYRPRSTSAAGLYSESAKSRRGIHLDMGTFRRQSYDAWNAHGRGCHAKRKLSISVAFHGRENRPRHHRGALYSVTHRQGPIRPGS